APSVARTANVCWPCARFDASYGDVHGAYGEASRLHANVAGSLAVNVKPALIDGIVPLGPLVITVSGGSLSTLQLRVAGAGSTLPARSRARTANECAPSASGPNASPVAHGE